MAANKIYNEGDSPARKKPGRIFVVSIILFVFVISGLIFLSLKWMGNRPVKRVFVSGNSIVPDDEITGKISDSLLNSTNNNLNLGKIKEKLDGNPFIEQTNVMHKSSDEINIEVRERIPVATIVYNDGGIGFIDKEGFTLPYRLFSKFPDLPLFRNIYSNDKIDRQAMKWSLSILNELKKEGNKFISRYISEIVYNSESKTFTLISTHNNARIFLGYLNNLEQKIKNLSEYWLERMPGDISAGIKYIDLRWADRLVVGFENKNLALKEEN